MNINPLARWYRWVEYCTFGRALERRRFAFLDRLRVARKLLILGEGDGRALSRLLLLAPQASIDVLEMSGEMIALARKRIGPTARVRFLQHDVRLAELPVGPFDGLVTCFFLDCFGESEARALVGRLERVLAPGGLWLMSDFAVPAFGWQRWHARIWVGTMYLFFRVTTGLKARELPPVEELLTNAGMARIARQEERGGMIVSEVWQKRNA